MFVYERYKKFDQTSGFVKSRLRNIEKLAGILRSLGNLMNKTINNGKNMSGKNMS